MKKYLWRFWNWWPPFLFTGIKILHVSPDFRHVVTKLKLRFWNSNYVGTLFGGALYSVADPFYMIMLIENLGRGYVVWDKSAHITYLKPGKTDVTAEFVLTEEDIAGIRAQVEKDGRMDWSRKIEIKDIKGQIVAEVEKVIYIRKKD